MALQPVQYEIAKVIGYEPLTEDEGSAQYPVDVDYQDAPKGAMPCTGNVYKNKKGILRCYWIPTSGRNGQYSTEESEELTGWYDVPTLEDIEEQIFDSVSFTPCGDEVEPDHIDSWLSILKLI